MRKRLVGFFLLIGSFPIAAIPLHIKDPMHVLLSLIIAAVCGGFAIAAAKHPEVFKPLID